MEVRAATAGDADAIARVHAATWEATYVGRVPEAVVRERLARARERDWNRHLADRAAAGGGVLVLVRRAHVVGFCEHGPTEDADDRGDRVGHVMRLYVLPEAQGAGGGRRLLEAACHGYEEVTLWTPEPPWNRAHGFYARLGWVREDVRNDDDPPDVRYRLRREG